jgi:hypothetical protein
MQTLWWHLMLPSIFLQLISRLGDTNVVSVTLTYACLMVLPGRQSKYDNFKTESRHACKKKKKREKKRNGRERCWKLTLVVDNSGQ